MNSYTLDLCEERCPMALLIAKRRAASLKRKETLVIQVHDKSSIQDMIRYFSSSLFSIHLEENEYMSTLTVVRESDS
ncbi:sulfurtransferase TusA family protein [Vibrio sp. S9_S30]|uniref:sulfurtransferase TusA family protein n=1 Tax=Vibrio sp. S9_S30 TaxID=2720226 RepID=UPI001680FDFD|nr:sulfurtransferase TusA family protein [Vibrio sp. S9_S30]MBD1556002.1 sulfurtransferase TusA family protein [Vibrio sp. S9_S30]